MLHICIETSVVLIASGTFILFPFAFSKLKAFLKFSYISSPIAPSILAKAIWLPKSIISGINVTILEDVCPLAML